MADPTRFAALPCPALLRLLDLIDAIGADAAKTWYSPAEERPTLPPEAADAALRLRSDCGQVVLWGDSARIVVAPPFPVTSVAAFDGYRTQELRDLLTRPRTLGVVLVRLGGYSVGLYEEGTFTEAKTGGRFVKNRHRKGGQSQRRFERIREVQIREHFDDVAEAIHARLLPAAERLDAVVLGGDRRTVQALLKRAPLPAALAAKVLPRVIDTPEPRRDVLERAPAAIWSSRALIVREPFGAERPTERDTR